MEIITAQHITKRHKGGHGIEDISFSVRKGQCFGVLGANGSGKTTLTRLIAGLDRLEQGRLLVFDRSGYPHPAALRRRCGIALDTPAHWETLSGRQNLFFFARQYGLAGAALNERMDELLREADLTAQADEPIAAYSFGMRRKLNSLQALAHAPDLLILDEPSAGVDMAFLDRLAQWIRQRCNDGKTTWIADNDAGWLGQVATDVIYLSEGRVTAGGGVKDLMESIDARYRIEISLEQPAFSDTPTLPGVRHFHCEKNRIRADLNGRARLPVELLEWITDRGGQVRSMEIRAITLHEALLQSAEQKEAPR